MQFQSFFLAAALLVSAEAFAPARIASRSFSRSGALQASDKPLTELCEITKEACVAVAPMLNGKWIAIGFAY